MRIEAIGQATLFLGDCADVLPTLAKADLLITDPPYGIGRANGMGCGGLGGRNGDNVRKPKKYAGKWDKERPSKQAFDIVLASAEKHIIWGAQYFSDYLPLSTKWLFWDKLNGMPSYSDGELAWTSLGGTSLKKFSYCFSGNASRRDGVREHPTQKPVALMAWCLSLVPARSRVVDPYMGSGTIGVACIHAGFPYIGIEKDSAYFDIACRRIREAYEEKTASFDMFSDILGGAA